MIIKYHIYCNKINILTQNKQICQKYIILCYKLGMTIFDKIPVFDAVLKLEVTKGHLLWTFADVARLSNQKRSLLYYHFGKDSSVLLNEAWSYMLNNMFALKEPIALGIRERIKQIVNHVNNHPYLFILFFLEKRNNSEISRLIKQCEIDLINLLQQKYPKYSEKDILKIYLCELGAIAYQSLSNEEFDSIFPK